MIEIWKKNQKIIYVVAGTKTDTLDSFYHNLYSFYTNKMSIILKHSFLYSPYMLYVFLLF